MIDIFKALSDKNQLRILSLLVDHNLSINEIETSLKLSSSDTSWYLMSLINSGIVKYTNSAQRIIQINNKFKTKNPELWDYLQPRLKELPTFKMDSEGYKKIQNKFKVFKL